MGSRPLSTSLGSNLNTAGMFPNIHGNVIARERAAGLIELHALFGKDALQRAANHRTEIGLHSQLYYQ